MDAKWIRVLSVAATVIGLGATLVSDWAKDVELDNLVQEKVKDALDK